MKLAEKLIASIVLLGIILQLLSIDGGLLLNTFASLILALFYFFLGIFLFNDIQLKNIVKKGAYEGIKWYRLLLAFVTSVVFVIMLAAILFGLSKWEGAFLLLRVGSLLLLPICVVSLIKGIRNPSKYYAGILIRSGIMILAGVTLLIFL